MRTAILTEYGNSYKGVAECTLPIFEEYAARHGYELFVIDLEDTPFPFRKHKAIKDLFRLGIELIHYLDIDAIYTNHTQKIESFINKTHDFYITRDFNELNGGSIIIKNTWNGRHFNDLILGSEPYYDNEQNVFNAYERQLGSNGTMKILPHPSINSYDYSLYPECIECLGNGYKGDWTDGHFVFHVPALALEKRIEVLTKMKEKIIR